MIRNLRLSAKLIVGFSVISIFCLIVGLVGLYGLNRMQTENQYMYDENTVPILGVSRSVFHFLREANDLSILNGAVSDTERHAKILADIEEDNANFNKYMAEYAATVEPGSKEETILQQASVLFGQFDAKKKLLIQQATSGDDAGAEATALEIDGLVDQIYTLANSAIDENDGEASRIVSDTTQLFKLMLFVIIGVIVIAVLASLLLGLYNARLIGRPAVQMLTVAKKLSHGDIDVRIESTSRDEIGQLGDAFTELISSIRAQSDTLERLALGDFSGRYTVRSDKDVMGMSIEKIYSQLNNAFEEILLSTEQVSNGSRQIAEGSQSLAQGSTEQAASVEELSASINQITQQTQENTAKAERASDLSNQIKDNATTGMTNMKDMLRAVDEINEASNQISRVIKVIDDIAFQTNILALNAAVEAARAGQHGKGFAVVAEEVRSLASRSAEAAKETTTLIENSISKADEGRRIATVTAKNLDDIVSGVIENTGIISDIAISSQEQTMAISQINTGIEQVSQVVQANSATAEESAAASEEMSSQASVLASLVSRFSLRNPSPGQKPPFHAPLRPRANQKKQLSMPAKGTARDSFSAKSDNGSTTHVYYPEDVAESGFGKY